MNNKSTPWFFAVIGLIVGILVMYLVNNFTIEKKNNTNNTPKSEQVNYGSTTSEENNINTSDQQSIDQLTEEKRVISYVKQNHKLPDYYITKNEARRQGWNPSQGNLCEVLPGRAIGGDKFSNREGNLPKGERYFEADVNYNCGNRNADRIVFTEDGDVYLTKNHYKSFEKQ
ncbi:hypothetical protein MUU74_09885 [Chryseobacterium daecheongense]|uniref:ribonuclease domain-containing protein n=1 Tax=Chryseobacterium daecheongense TaxID=192389 RepID=UPI001FD6E05C|nr:ribonuclease domain-containing protein [Chryseobacterium daecheongense]UOU96804.1 hypothetical protein MUU74_09885 [Chryseobacterium daecheongense]